jgi:hypothetical protein
MAQRRRRDPELRGGGAKAQMIGNGNERGQVRQLASAHC